MKLNGIPENNFGKSILQVPDTGTRVLDNTRPFLRSSIESFWITPACSKERKYHIFKQYWYTRNVPVFINTGTFQYLGPQVYFFHNFLCIFIIASSPGVHTFFCLWRVNKKLPQGETSQNAFQRSRSINLKWKICMLKWVYPSLKLQSQYIIFFIPQNFQSEWVYLWLWPLVHLTLKLDL